MQPTGTGRSRYRAVSTPSRLPRSDQFRTPRLQGSLGHLLQQPDLFKDFYWSLNEFDSFDSDPPGQDRKNDLGTTRAERQPGPARNPPGAAGRGGDMIQILADRVPKWSSPSRWSLSQSERVRRAKRHNASRLRRIALRAGAAAAWNACCDISGLVVRLLLFLTTPNTI
jgi:hypothetical protein